MFPSAYVVLADYPEGPEPSAVCSPAVSLPPLSGPLVYPWQCPQRLYGATECSQRTCHRDHQRRCQIYQGAVHPVKYISGFVLLSFTLVIESYNSITHRLSFRLSSLALGQWHDCASAIEVTSGMSWLKYTPGRDWFSVLHVLQSRHSKCFKVTPI